MIHLPKPFGRILLPAVERKIARFEKSITELPQPFLFGDVGSQQVMLHNEEGIVNVLSWQYELLHQQTFFNQFVEEYSNDVEITEHKDAVRFKAGGETVLWNADMVNDPIEQFKERVSLGQMVGLPLPKRYQQLVQFLKERDYTFVRSVPLLKINYQYKVDVDTELHFERYVEILPNLETIQYSVTNARLVSVITEDKAVQPYIKYYEKYKRG